MKLNLDSVKIDIPCEKCGHKLKETLSRLKRNPQLTCICRQVIDVNADHLRRVIEQAQKSLGAFLR